MSQLIKIEFIITATRRDGLNSAKATAFGLQYLPKYLQCLSSETFYNMRTNYRVCLCALLTMIRCATRSSIANRRIHWQRRAGRGGRVVQCNAMDCNLNLFYGRLAI